MTPQEHERLHRIRPDWSFGQWLAHLSGEHDALPEVDAWPALVRLHGAAHGGLPVRSP